MRLVSFDGGFGRLDDDQVVPMGAELPAYLATGEATDAPAVALAVWLRDRDVVEVEIDGVGTLTNPVRTGSASG